MNFRAAERLDVFPMSDVLVVDDTAPGVEAGRNAGAWTVGVTRTGNSIGLSREEVAAADPAELAARIDAAAGLFKRLGAHYVIESVADLIPVIDDLESGRRDEA
jgi:phosphonoacetaldehyde hydrolase